MDPNKNVFGSFSSGPGGNLGGNAAGTTPASLDSANVGAMPANVNNPATGTLPSSPVAASVTAPTNLGVPTAGTPVQDSGDIILSQGDKDETDKKKILIIAGTIIVVVVLAIVMTIALNSNNGSGDQQVPQNNSTTSQNEVTATNRLINFLYTKTDSTNTPTESTLIEDRNELGEFRTWSDYYAYYAEDTEARQEYFSKLKVILDNLENNYSQQANNNSIKDEIVAYYYDACSFVPTTAEQLIEYYNEYGAGDAKAYINNKIIIPDNSPIAIKNLITNMKERDIFYVDIFNDIESYGSCGDTIQTECVQDYIASNSGIEQRARELEYQVVEDMLGLRNKAQNAMATLIKKEYGQLEEQV